MYLKLKFGGIVMVKFLYILLIVSMLYLTVYSIEIQINLKPVNFDFSIHILNSNEISYLKYRSLFPIYFKYFDLKTHKTLYIREGTYPMGLMMLELKDHIKAAIEYFNDTENVSSFTIKEDLIPPKFSIIFPLREKLIVLAAILVKDDNYFISSQGEISSVYALATEVSNYGLSSELYLFLKSLKSFFEAIPAEKIRPNLALYYIFMDLDFGDIFIEMIAFDQDFLSYNVEIIVFKIS